MIKRYEFVTSITMVILLPLVVTGFIIVFLFRPIYAGGCLGYYIFDIWKLNIFQKEQENKVRQDALNQLSKYSQDQG